MIIKNLKSIINDTKLYWQRTFAEMKFSQKIFLSLVLFFTLIEQPWSFFVLVFILPYIQKGIYNPKFLFITSSIYLFYLFKILTNQIYYNNDYEQIANAAQLLSLGYTQFIEWPYFKAWNHQIGITLYYSQILKICNINIATTFTNTISILITFLCIYHANPSKKVISCFLLSIPFWIRLSLPTNELPFIALSSLALLIFFKNKKYIILSGILLGLAQNLRPESILIFILIFILISFKKTKVHHGFFLIITSTFFGHLISNIPLLFNIPTQISINDPLWKFTVGTNISSYGTYSELLFPLVNHRLAEIQHINSQINQPIDLTFALIKKTSLFWGRWDNTLQFININGIYIIPFSIIEKIIFIYLIIQSFKNKSLNKIFFCFILAYASIYIFIEISPRYKIILWPMMIFLSTQKESNAVQT